MITNEPIIKVSNLTKNYGNNQGVFDLNFTIHKGEMVGFVGTNGSGKSTTIRLITGFIKPDSGTSTVYGYDSWTESSKFIRSIGYVPGEIAFPDLFTGKDFLKSQAELLKIQSFDYANKIIELLQLDIRANLKRMSKGMKQKTALVAALMSDPELLILDEPTTGLDPLMRIKFIDAIKQQHLMGKTILMSSQSFEELERTCDKVIFIYKGHILAIANMHEIANRNVQDLKIEFYETNDYLDFKSKGYKIIRDQMKYNQLTIEVKKDNIGILMNDLSSYNIKFISEVPYTLETHFKRIAKIKEEK